MPRTKPRSLKKDGRYKDAPRYKAIYGYEDEFRQGFSVALKASIKELSNKLKKL